MDIVFFGTPEFAVGTLSAILQTRHRVVAVVTAPDKPAGRGQEMQYSDVKKFALEHQLPLLQPDKLKDPVFIGQLQALHADVFVVVAFRMMPEVVYAMPPKGTFNVHASLLPDYRGAAPIQRALMNGEKQSGVTTFFLNQIIDTGDIIDQVVVPVRPDENAGELYDELMSAGAALAVKTLDAIADGTCKTKPQNLEAGKTLHTAPKIFKEDMHIDWNGPAEKIYNQIRGLSPYPGAFGYLKDSAGHEYTLKCYQAEISDKKSTCPPGTITIENAQLLTVATADRDIILKNIQLQGKKRMNAKDFLAGFRQEKYILNLY